MNSCNAHAQMCHQVDIWPRIADERRTGQARAQGQPSRAQVRAREAEDKVHMSARGVKGNGGSPAGRINAALE